MDDEPAEAAAAATALASTPTVVPDGSLTLQPPPSAQVVVIAPRGDVVLDVVFETSAATLRAARRASRGRQRQASTSTSKLPPPKLQRRLRVAFRVDAAALKKHSRYFANLLGDTRFQEARAVETALAALALDGILPAEAETARLPWVRIDDDDEGSRSVGRELVFAELLRILHGGEDAAIAAASVPASIASTTAAKTAAKTASKSATKTAVKTADRSAARAKPAVRPKTTTTPTAATTTTAATTSKKLKVPAEAAAAAPPLPGSCWSARTPPSLPQLAVLALQADRFDCAAPVAAHVRSLRVRFPQPVVRAARDDSSNSTSTSSGSGNGNGSSPPGLANEEAIRQKIFVSWVLDQPVHFDRGTRELILYGSQRWARSGGCEDDDDDDDDDDDEGERVPGSGSHHPEDGLDNDDGGSGGDDDPSSLATWWDLPDGLEGELRFRRACIVRCIASVPRHFLGLYTSRSRHECKMGYGSSAACDSFQLGEMVRFLCQRDLLHLRVFGPSPSPSSASSSSFSAVDVYHILATLRQCPAYQLDRDHVNCGLRTRMLPILEYIQAMLAANAVAIRRRDWHASSPGRAQKGVEGPSWEAAGDDDDGDDGGDDDDNDNGNNGTNNGGCIASGPLFAPRRVFRFTRAVAGDQRLRLEGNMAADRMARTLFTARRWNWTPEN